jgi:hypothetical protein
MADYVFRSKQQKADFIFWTCQELCSSVRNCEGKRPFGRPRRKWVGNVNMNHKEKVCKYEDLINIFS